ncbi:WXG100 family type VII secretion target [Goodfellowiella coeruleoviolacea]|nr:hypothetical protein [Goodfellowiella coeruleoviolacea]
MTTPVDPADTVRAHATIDQRTGRVIGPPRHPLPAPDDELPILRPPHEIRPAPTDRFPITTDPPGDIRPISPGSDELVPPITITGRLPVDGPPPVRQPAAPGGAGAGSGTGFHVDPGQLRAVSGHATRIGDDIADTVSRFAGSLTASGQHAGWALGGALERCTGAWERHLGDTARRVRAVGGGLAETVAHYSDVDSGNGLRFKAIRSQNGQG